MSIDKETIKHISKLARISLDDKKIDNLSKDLSSIIKFIEKLSKLNTDDIKPLTSIIEASLKFRKDEILDGKIRDQILKNSPEKNEEFFVVPKVVE
jgi:aspartyl-tRNA(Asn)/glutamyl-tRNA(Gln) amidotransferase subunit C